MVTEVGLLLESLAAYLAFVSVVKTVHTPDMLVKDLLVPVGLWAMWALKRWIFCVVLQNVPVQAVIATEGFPAMSTSRRYLCHLG